MGGRHGRPPTEYEISRVVRVRCENCRVDVLHVLYGGLGGQVAVVRALAREMGALGLTSGACLYGPGSELLLSPSEWPELQVVDAIDKRHRLDLPGAREIGRSVQRRRPRAVIWHSHYAPLPLWRASRSGLVRSTLLVEHQPTQSRSVWDNLRSLVGLPMSSALVVLTERYPQDYPFSRLPVAAVRGLRVIPNGIDLGVFAPAVEHRSSSRNHLVVGMMARMTETKDFATLVRAVRELRVTAPCLEFEVRFAGDGPERRSLEGLAARLGVADRVRFLGRLDIPELVAFLHDLDLYVHSTVSETMSTAIIQAYAVGLPVIATDVPGVNDLVRDGRDGLLVPLGDARQFAKTIVQLAGAPERRAALGAAARLRAESDFGQALMTHRYLKLLESLDPEGPWGRAAG